MARPTIKGEVRLIGLDDTVNADEVCTVIAKIGRCFPEDIKMGAIRTISNGLGSIWAQCSLAVATKASATKKIRIGWIVARIELLKSRPVQCFKCWEYGHVRHMCKSAIDSSGFCFRCGIIGHLACQCQAIPRCLVCAGYGVSNNHRIGYALCKVNLNVGNARTIPQNSVATSERKSECTDIPDGN